MNPNRSAVDVGTAGKLLGAVVVGLSLGTLLPTEPVALPVVGTVPGLLAGGVGLVVGWGVFTRSGASDCGCGGDCGC